MAMTTEQLQDALNNLVEAAEMCGQVRQRVDCRKKKYADVEAGSPAEQDLKTCDRMDKESVDRLQKSIDEIKQKIMGV